MDDPQPRAAAGFAHMRVGVPEAQRRAERERRLPALDREGEQAARRQRRRGRRANRREIAEIDQRVGGDGEIGVAPAGSREKSTRSATSSSS